ncbi:hypothetical protein NE236_28790 [Actinoallomurus purpureus]|uniref:hypothetical protein n=1 Tax=Actinoallomurus purpureus TaxID=478114 RepID=UPI00209272BE|nr:hypothetical protein [Actinoallomurus purpureus]MCO6008978.1 hypothetical protein [Actinoallomurus purpureus]
MTPLQVVTFIAAQENMRTHARSALPDAPKVPYVPEEPRTPVVRTTLAALLRRTAARLEPSVG